MEEVRIMKWSDLHSAYKSEAERLYKKGMREKQEKEIIERRGGFFISERKVIEKAYKSGLPHLYSDPSDLKWE